MARGDAGGAGGGDAGGDADAVAPSGPPSSTGTENSELGCTCSVQAARVLSTLYIRTMPGIIGAIAHWQEGGAAESSTTHVLWVTIRIY